MLEGSRSVRGGSTVPLQVPRDIHMRDCPFRDVTTCGRENLQSMAARKSQHCGDKSHLLAEYNRSVLEWSNALRNLGEKPDDTEFAVLLAKVDEARAKTRRAKSAYNAHVAEHDC